MRLTGAELCLSLLLCAFYFTNKYILSVLKFTYPTLFQGWQVSVGVLLLLVTWKLGWVEIRSNILWSAKISWFPGALLFVGTIYAGSRALSKLPIPFFLVFHNVSELVATILEKLSKKEKLSFMKFLSLLLVLLAAVCLPFNDLQLDLVGYFWAVIHCLCAGGYKVFQKLPKSCLLSEFEQQSLNYLYSLVLLVFAAHFSGDAISALEFPFLYFYRFLGGCCASGILGFCVLLASVKVKSYFSTDQFGAWMLFTKILASSLSLRVFETYLNVPTSCCLFLGVLGEALFFFNGRRNESLIKG